MELEDLINRYAAEVQTLLRTAHAELMEYFPALVEEPDFPSRILVYRIAPGNDGIVFTLIPSRAGVKLGIYRGRELPDPAGLLAGNGKVHATISLSERIFNDKNFADLLEAAMRKALLRNTRR